MTDLTSTQRKQVNSQVLRQTHSLALRPCISHELVRRDAQNTTNVETNTPSRSSERSSDQLRTPLASR